MRKFDYILFDLDGTVTDSGPGIMKAASIALESFGIKENDEKKLRLFVGPPLDKSFMERYNFSEEDAWKAIGAFRDYYNETGVYENSVYPGIEDLLKELKKNGYTIAIASSKPQNLIHIVLSHFHIEEYFDVIVGCELDGTRSDKAEVIKEVLRQLGELDASRDILSRTVMIGDRCYDVAGAHAFSLPCIGVLYGYGTREEMKEAGADYVAETPEDILKLV